MVLAKEARSAAEKKKEFIPLDIFAIKTIFFWSKLMLLYLVGAKPEGGGRNKKHGKNTEPQRELELGKQGYLYEWHPLETKWLL